MKRESKYIFRRVISGVLIALILTFIKSCDVKAATYNIAPSSCGVSNNSSFSNGTVSGNTSSVNYSSPFYFCSAPSSLTNYLNVRYGVIFPSSISTSTGVISFNIRGENISNVVIRTGGYDYQCLMNTGYTGSNTQNMIYSVVCNNVPMSANRTYTIYINKISQSGASVFISSNYLYIPNENISSVINEQSQQQHQDAENTQNAINDVNDSITNDNVDDQGSFFSGFDQGSTGSLMDLISLPLDFINNLNNSCQPINLPKLKMFSFELDITIPCLSTYVYNKFGSTLINTLRLLINGVLIYLMLKWFIDFIQRLKDPNNDDLEVMDL